MKIRTAVIPAAGMGTRFLPVTKVVPKELIPVIDKPGLQYAVEEAISVGIENVILITASGKESLVEYFYHKQNPENYIQEKHQPVQLENLEKLTSSVNITSIVQNEQLGLGHAIACASEQIHNEPFAVILPDDLILGSTPALKQLLDVFDTYETSVLAVQKVRIESIHKYGVIEPVAVGENIFKVSNAVEKPTPEQAPSDYGIIGRYIFTPGILERITEAQPGAVGEIQLTDAIADLTNYEPVYALNVDGTRHDIGTPLGMLKASIDIGISRDDIGHELIDYINKLTETH